MAFLNDIGKKIGSTAGATAAKAKNLAEITKLNSQISDQEKQIDKLYLEIGKKVFEAEKENFQSPLIELCGKIIAAQLIISGLKQRIDEIKNAKDLEGTV